MQFCNVPVCECMQNIKELLEVTLYRMFQKSDTRFNFVITSANVQILTIFSLLEEEIYDA